MAGRSIRCAVIVAALASIASAPALAQRTPPSDDGRQQSDRDRGYGADDGSAQDDGGFATRDAVPPDASPAAPSSGDEDNGRDSWHDDQPSSEPVDRSGTVPDAQRNGWPAPSGPALTEPETAPGYQASTGIDNRNQAVSSCLAAVRSRVGGGAGAARVDGINGDWMVSGAVEDGRAFYCSIRHGAIDDVQFGS